MLDPSLKISTQNTFRNFKLPSPIVHSSTPKVEPKPSTSKRVATKKKIVVEESDEEEEEEVIPKSTVSDCSDFGLFWPVSKKFVVDIEQNSSDVQNGIGLE